MNQAQSVSAEYGIQSQLNALQGEIVRQENIINLLQEKLAPVLLPVTSEPCKNQVDVPLPPMASFAYSIYSLEQQIIRNNTELNRLINLLGV